MNDFVANLAAKATCAKFQAGRAIRNKLEGQTLIEYVLIIALLSLVSIAVIALCGDQIRHAFDNVTKVLGNATSSNNNYTGSFVG